jgi:manganese transport protein
MGEFVNPWWVKALAWLTAAVVIALNAKLVLDFLGVTSGAGVS